MKRADLEKYQREFELVNQKDNKAFKRWFIRHKHLTINDLAQIANKTTQQIRIIKKKLGLKGGRKTMDPPKPINLPQPTIDVPENWRTAEWLGKMIQIHSMNSIAKAVKRDRSIIRTLLERYKIPWRNAVDANKSKNKCCTHAWCYQHYIKLKMSQAECAKTAGVARQTFIGWLNKFKIPVRDKVESSTGRINTSLWEHELTHNLKKCELVKWVQQKEGYTHVRFKNYFWENYHFEPLTERKKRPYTFVMINRNETTIKKIPIVYPKYGVNIDGSINSPAHIEISRKDLEKATTLEKRLALHEFARQLVMRGWVDPTFPNDVIEHDFNRVVNFDMDKYYVDGVFTTIPKGVKGSPGKRTMMHFFNFEVYHSLIKSPSYVTRFLTTLMKKTCSFDFYHLLMLIISSQKLVFRKETIGRLAANPVVYHAIFKKLKLEGQITDLYVGFGNRALACAAAGLAYTTPDLDNFNYAVNKGFVEFSGLKYKPYEDGQSIDILLYDEDFRPPKMEKVIPYINKAKRILVFAPPSHRNEVMRYNPRSAIRIRTRLYDKTPGYLFVW